MESMIGKIIDNYRIQEELGRGGMGIVYKAIDINLDREVAIKMLTPELAGDKLFLKTFRREAKTLAKIEDPNIVTIHAFRELGQDVFIVMQYIDGITLADHIKEKGAFTPAEAFPIFKQILTAIGHAHQEKVIHRDIKPRNIMLTRKGLVKITDFGLAKVQYGGDTTITMVKGGTLYYSSPEQIKGMKEVNHLSDIYSIGMTFYEMLAGRTPFDKTDSGFTVQMKIVEGKLPSPVKFNPAIPKALANIITKAIDKDPVNRYQGAEEMLRDLEQYQITSESAQLDTSIAPISKKLTVPTTTIPKKWPGPILITVFIATLIILLLGLGLKNFTSIFGHKQKPDATESTTLARNESGKKIDTMKQDSTGAVAPDTQATREIPITIYGSIHINSQPTGSSVWLNNTKVGTTPYEKLDMEPGDYHITLKKTGYSDFTTLIKIVADRPTNVTATLESVPPKPIITPEEMTGSLVVNSDPSGADIYIDGTRLGKTPVRDKKMKIGTYQIAIQKSGYEPYSESVQIQQDRSSAISTRLIPLRGTLKILVRPWGEIIIDGKTVEKEALQPYQTILPAGSHRLLIKHPGLGTWEKTVTIRANEESNIFVNFNQMVKITVISNPSNSEIFIDGKSIGANTPKVLQLNVGQHSIEVRRDGYRLAGTARVILLEEDLQEPISFTLEKIE